MKQTKITMSARGEQCQVRIPGVCSFDPEKTVLAHKNGAGLAKKCPDFIGAYCCSNCHSFIDGGWVNSGISNEQVLVWFYEGIFRTQEILRAKGLIKINGEK